MKMNTVHNNTTIQPSLGETCKIHFKETMLLVLYSLIILIGVIGNSAILYVFGYRNKQRKTSTELLILYLGLFDLLASIFGPFIFIYWIVTCNRQWNFGMVGCKILPLLSRLFNNISVGIILILALDRYRAICTPFRGQFRRRYIYLSVCITIILSITCEYYYIVSLTVAHGPYSYGCAVIPTNKAIYRTFTSAILLVRGFIVIVTFTFTTISIVHALYKRDQFLIQLKNIKNKNEMKRVVRVVIVMEIVFLILVLPRDMLHAVFSLSWLDNDGIPFTKDIILLNEFLKLFQTANCCANIFIYAKLHDRFRESFIEALSQSIGFKNKKTSSSSPEIKRFQRYLTASSCENDYKNTAIKLHKRQLLTNESKFKLSFVTSNSDILDS